jgi:hypothetical protein
MAAADGVGRGQERIGVAEARSAFSGPEADLTPPFGHPSPRTARGEGPEAGAVRLSRDPRRGGFAECKVLYFSQATERERMFPPW